MALNQNDFVEMKVYSFTEYMAPIYDYVFDRYEDMEKFDGEPSKGEYAFRTVRVKQYKEVIVGYRHTGEMILDMSKEMVHIDDVPYYMERNKIEEAKFNDYCLRKQKQKKDKKTEESKPKKNF